MALSRLADAEAGKTASRWLPWLCATGYLTTMAGQAALGYGLERWLFFLLVWAVLIFVPLRIAIEPLQTLGAGMRRQVVRRIPADPRRYEDPALLALFVAELFEQAVTMPRITLPQHARAAREAAVAILARTAGRAALPATLLDATRTAVAVIAREVAEVSEGATGATAASIQTRWDGARTLGGLAAMAQILDAAFTDRWGAPPDLPEMDGRPVRAFLEDVLEYCDEAALQVDALPWTRPPCRSPRPADRPAEDLDAVWAAWRAFVTAGSPSPRAQAALVGTILSDAAS